MIRIGQAWSQKANLNTSVFHFLFPSVAFQAKLDSPDGLLHDPHWACLESKSKSWTLTCSIFFFHLLPFKQSLTAPSEKRKAPTKLEPFAFIEVPSGPLMT